MLGAVLGPVLGEEDRVGTLQKLYGSLCDGVSSCRKDLCTILFLNHCSTAEILPLPSQGSGPCFAALRELV